MIFSSLEKAPLACEFSPRTFNASCLLLILNMYMKLLLLFPILTDAVGDILVNSEPSLKGAYCLVTVSPTILIVIELASFDVSLIVGVGVLLLMLKPPYY